MTTANYFTFIRLLIAPLFLVVYTQHQWFGISPLMLPWVLLSLLTLSEISDAFDGYLARKFKEVTDLGKILDPMADSISHIAIFMTFTTGVIGLPLWMPFALFYREAVISTLRTVCALRGFALAARSSGKIKAVTQAVAAYSVVLAMIPHSLGWMATDTLQQIAFGITAVSVVYTIFSGTEYIVANWHHVKQLLVVKKEQGHA